ncbi:hypothetical protein ACTGW9_01665 [Streptococcus suis]
MAKKIRDEHGNVYVQKKPFYKRIWFIVLVRLFVLGGLQSVLSGGEFGKIANGGFLVLKVTVKNNGKEAITVRDDFFDRQE